MLSTILNMVLIALGLTAFLSLLLLSVILFIISGVVIFGVIDAIAKKNKVQVVKFVFRKEVKLIAYI